MKTQVMVLLAGAALAAASSAQAEGGCGPGGYRGPYGGCRSNGGFRRGPVVAGPALGVFYPGRGYWDGRGYRHERYRFGGGWRYR